MFTCQYGLNQIPHLCSQFQYRGKNRNNYSTRNKVYQSITLRIIKSRFSIKNTNISTYNLSVDNSIDEVSYLVWESVRPLFSIMFTCQYGLNQIPHLCSQFQCRHHSYIINTYWRWKQKFKNIPLQCDLLKRNQCRIN
jgi:hypothetical protein